MHSVIFGVAFLAMSVALAACRPLWIASVNPSGPPEYKLGWEDGCDSGVSAEDSGPIYKMALGFKRRAEMAENDQYKRGWNEGFSYCRFSYAATKGDSDTFFR